MERWLKSHDELVSWCAKRFLGLFKFLKKNVLNATMDTDPEFKNEIRVTEASLSTECQAFAVRFSTSRFSRIFFTRPTSTPLYDSLSPGKPFNPPTL